MKRVLRSVIFSTSMLTALAVASCAAPAASTAPAPAVDSASPTAASSTAAAAGTPSATASAASTGSAKVTVRPQAPGASPIVAYPEAIDASMVANNFFHTLRNELQQPAMMGAPAGTPMKDFYPKTFAMVSESLPEDQAEKLMNTMRMTYGMWPNATLKFDPEKLPVENGKVTIDLSYVPATSPKTSGKFDGIDRDMPGDGYLELTKEAGSYKISHVSKQVGALGGCLWSCSPQG